MLKRIYFGLFALLTFSATSLANDLYPTNLKPALFSTFSISSPIVVSCDIFFVHDYPVVTGECSVTATIKDQANNAVYTSTRTNITGNGPNVSKPVSFDDFSTSSTNTYTLSITVNYVLDINNSNNTSTTTFVVTLPVPPDITNFFPANDATNVPFGPPPAFTWENGDSPITEQGMEIKLGNTFIVSQNLPPDATSFIPSNDLLPSSQYEWYLVQSNSAGTTVNGPFNFFTSEAFPPSPFNFEFEVNKVDYEFYTPPSPIGMITTIFDPGAEGVYINVIAHNLNSDMSAQIISNLFLPPSTVADPQTELTTFFDFTSISPPPYSTPFNTELEVYVFDSPNFPPFEPTTLIDTKTAVVIEVNYDPIGVVVPENQTIEIKSVTRPEHTIGDPQTVLRYRSNAPNLDLDDSQHGDSESFAGDLNACVPTATANSMKWMEETYTDFNLPEQMGLRETMETLSGLMQRENNKGTFTDKMVKGKLDFMEQFNLPVEVKFQAFFDNGNIASTSGNSLARNFNTGKPPTWEFLKKMMMDGEDVEMNFTWKDNSDGEWYAHSVNITGINEFESGVKKIAFKHDTRQRTSGGLKQEIHEISIDEKGWMRFGEHSENFIKDVVVESPVVPEGQETAAWLNEIFAIGGTFKINNAAATDEFIEIIINQNISDLQNYRINIYNGSGNLIEEVALDQFAGGATVDSFIVYSYIFNGDVLSDTKGGIGISFSGSPIPFSFISWGGIINAVNGDWTGLTSIDIGIIPTAGNSIALTGTGTDFQSFNWVNSPTPSPGNLNPSQEVPVELTAFTASFGKNNVLLKWSTATETNNSGFEVEKSNVKNQNSKFNWQKIGFITGAGTTVEKKDYSFVDKNISAGKYSYRLKQIDLDGAFEYSDVVEVEIGIPVEYSLAQNYPNPFNPVTVIEYSIPESERVKLTVYNLLGELVKTLIDGNQEAGVYKIDFNGADLISGVYFYHLQAGEKEFTRKMTLIK